MGVDVFRGVQLGPPRKYYSLTAAGRNSLTEMRSEWRSFVDEVNGVLALSGTSSGTGEKR